MLRRPKYPPVGVRRRTGAQRTFIRRALVAFALLCLAAPGVPPSQAGQNDATRAPILAGSWYPADPKILRDDLTSLLDAAPGPPINAQILALAVPHAGYVYSAKTAACAYSLVSGRSYDLVVVLSPSHRLAFEGVAAPQAQAFETPLGPVPVDRQTIKALMKAEPSIRILPEAHAREHAVEIQLPFLQTALAGPFNLVPLVMGEQDFTTCRKLADALARVLDGRRALLVASSDLSHFHPRPKARALDERFMEKTAAFDPLRLYECLTMGAREASEACEACEACGGGPVVTAMLAAKTLGAVQAKVLCYADSGEASGDTKEVVGYMAAVFLGPSDQKDK